MSRKRSYFAVVTTAVAAGLLLTACFTANLSGSASSPSPIAYSGATGPLPTWKKAVQLNLVVNDSLGTGIGGATGSLKDTGTNPLFPRGVKMSFANGISIGMGVDCTEGGIGGGPSRLVHGASSTSINPNDYCQNYADPRFWIGVVTYSSAEPRYYPNQGFQPCNEYYQYYLSEFSDIWSLRAPAMPTSSKGSTAENISGFGVATIIDTNYNRNYDRGDRFSFIPVCGPYTHLDGSGILPTAPAMDPAALLDSVELPAGVKNLLSRMQVKAPAALDPDPTLYNYAACGAAGGGLPFPTYGGAIPSDFIDDAPEVALMLSVYCAFYQPGTKGDLKIGIGTRITTTTSTTVGTVAPSP